MSYVQQFDIAAIPGENLPSDFGGTSWAIRAAAARYEAEPLVVTDAAPGAWGVSVNPAKTKVTVTMPDDFIYPVPFSLYYSPDGSTPYYADISKPYPVDYGEPGSTVQAALWYWGSIADYPANSWIMTADQGAGEGDGEVYFSTAAPGDWVVVPDTLTAPKTLSIFIPENVESLPLVDLIYYIDSTGATYKAIFGWQPATQFGSFIDETDTLYTAVDTGGTVRIFRFTGGGGSHEALALIGNAKNPSFALDHAQGTQFLSYEDRTDGAQKLIVSHDGGETFA